MELWNNLQFNVLDIALSSCIYLIIQVLLYIHDVRLYLLIVTLMPKDVQNGLLLNNKIDQMTIG